MGCDIHAMIERRGKYGWGWENAGAPRLDRNYEIFAILADESWGVDAHSASSLTLAEIKAFDAAHLRSLGWLDREYNVPGYGVRDKEGKATNG